MVPGFRKIISDADLLANLVVFVPVWNGEQRRLSPRARGSLFANPCQFNVGGEGVYFEICTMYNLADLLLQ